MNSIRISRFKIFLSLSVLTILSDMGYAQPLDAPSFLSNDVSYAWPTNAGRYLSSTFGETRSAHLHVGIDIKTWGREGFDVYATRDGVLFRIQTGPSGYGNALYLKHDDGSYSVYAHLRNFIPEITRLVDSVRIPELRHDVDILVEASELRFRKGQKIAYTGSTGIGPPHLHFELRSPDNVPYNPLYARFNLSDRIAPQLHALLVEEYGFANGNSSSESIRAIRLNQSERRPIRTLENGLKDFGTLETSGSVLLSVDASDRADDVTNVYAVYELQLYLEDSLVFSSRASRLPFESSSHMFVDRHYEWLRTKQKGFQRLHLVQGNRLPLYSNLDSDGILNLPGGPQTLTIVARDYFGNETKGILQVIQTQSAPGLTSKNISVLNPISDDNIKTIFKDLLREQDDQNSKSYVMDTLLHPGRSYFLETPDRRFFMDIQEGSLFETFRLTFSVSRASDEDLTFLITPNPIPFAKPVRIGASIGSVDSAPLKIGFAWLPNRPISTNRAASGRWITFETLELGPFTTYRDTLSPMLTMPKRVVLPEGMSSVELRITQEMSPLNRRSATFEIDGIPGIPIYDPEYKSFRFYHPEVSLSPGSTIRFSVADQFGNRSTGEWTYHNGVFSR